MRLALFDFDGTLTTKDSLNEFLKYISTRQDYIVKMLLFSPTFILYKLGLIKNDIAKERLLALFTQEFSEQRLKELAKEFSLTKIENFLRASTYKKLKEHQKNGDRVLIVSASMRCWLEPWCQREGVELLSTQLAFANSKPTGKFATKNCHAEEKVRRIKAHLNLKEYKDIYAYGDSSGDTAMLSLAHHKEWIRS